MRDVSEDLASPSFGHHLLRCRIAAQMSQADLARSSGLSVRALRELERGRTASAQERSVELLASALDLNGAERESFIRLAKDGRRRSAAAHHRTLVYKQWMVRAIVGRERELEDLSRAARAGGVVVVFGALGVGKTSLALTAADRFTPQFPDGCLALDLRGDDDPPLSPALALKQMLAALGVPISQIPATEIERSSLFRTLMRDRRVLVLLDNAMNEAQVRPLLASAEHSLTIVTCRRSLAGLETAQWILLDRLQLQSEVGLSVTIAAQHPVLGEPDVGDEIIQ